MELWTVSSGPRQRVGGMEGREREVSNEVRRGEESGLTNCDHTKFESESYLFVVSINVDKVEWENVVLSSNQ